MKFRTILASLAVATAFASTSGSAEEARVRINVTPQVGIAPAFVRIRAVVPPHADNRSLQIVADSGAYYRSSVVPLDGANAAMVTETTLKNLPSGTYQVVAVLVDAQGHRTRVRRQVIVRGSY